jgi:mutator protein MutT
MSTIECESIYGCTVAVPKAQLTFRPSVYAVIVHEGKVLLVTIRSSGKYDFPGGAIEIGETIEAALKREVREETGLDIEVDKFLHFEEGFFYYDPIDTAWHTFQFFYQCKPKTFRLLPEDQIDDDEVEHLGWFEIKHLNQLDFRAAAGKVLQRLRDLPSH